MRGYCGCECCEAIGQYVDGRVIYTDTNAPERSSQNWEKYMDLDELYPNAPIQTRFWNDVENETGNGHVISLESPFYSQECREILNVDMVRTVYIFFLNNILNFFKCKLRYTLDVYINVYIHRC